MMAGLVMYWKADNWNQIQLSNEGTRKYYFTQKEKTGLKIETNDLIIRNFELRDENDLCEYMLQRANAEFDAYPDFTCQKAKKEVEFRAQSDEFYAIELKKEHKVIGNIYLGKRSFNTRELGYVLNENLLKEILKNL